MTTKQMILAAVTMVTAVAASASPGVCSLDGTYVRSETIGQPQSQVLRIDGDKATVFDQALQRDDSGRVQRPIKFIGKPVAVLLYAVRADAATPNGLRFFNLVDTKTGASGYSGFNLDCKTKQLDHPSVGDWRRV